MRAWLHGTRHGLLALFRPAPPGIEPRRRRQALQPRGRWAQWWRRLGPPQPLYGSLLARCERAEARQRDGKENRQLHHDCSRRYGTTRCMALLGADCNSSRRIDSACCRRERSGARERGGARGWRGACDQRSAFDSASLSLDGAFCRGHPGRGCIAPPRRKDTHTRRQIDRSGCGAPFAATLLLWRSSVRCRVPPRYGNDVPIGALLRRRNAGNLGIWHVDGQRCGGRGPPWWDSAHSATRANGSARKRARRQQGIPLHARPMPTATDASSRPPNSPLLINNNNHMILLQYVILYMNTTVGFLLRSTRVVNMRANGRGATCGYTMVGPAAATAS